MGKNRRLRPLARRPPRYEPRSKILIVCEGEVTEPKYFRHVSALARNRLVEVVVEGVGADPKHLVERALERRRIAEQMARKEPFNNFDEVWCAFDVDEHRRFDAALDQARANGIGVALSNPSFELWALLHFQDQSRALHRQEARKLLKIHMPGYAKSLDLRSMTPGIQDACRRARELDARHKANGSDGNPSSKVYLLCDIIMRERP